MSVENKTPAIRFASYSDSWIKKLLADVLDERKILQKITKDAPILSFAAGQGVIDRSERKSNNRDHLTLDQSNKIYKLTEYNDIVYNPSNLKYGAIDRNKHGRGVISPIYVTFTTEEIPSFIEIIVKSEKFKLRALAYEEGTVVKRQSVKPENLLSLEVNISPSLDEQTKIGNYFQQLETLIAQHQQKHDKLLTLKKSLLEKMLPKQGATVPEIRFKGFSREWEEKEIQDVANRYDNLRIPITAKDRITGSTPYYGANGIQDYVEGHTHDGEFVLVAEDGANDLKNYPVQYVNGKIWVNNHAHVLQAKNNTTDNYFLKLSISHAEIESLLVGGGRAKLNADTMMKIFIDISSENEEQTKIGNFFKSLDTLLNQHQSQLKKLNNIKQACLEIMFV